MTIVFYHALASAPCRAVEMTADHLGVELEKRFVDLLAGEQMEPEFLEMNPQHCVPVIEDDGFFLWESRAIQAYLVNKYAPDSDLYPSDPHKRVIVDKMLYFDAGILFNSMAEYVRPIVFGAQPPDEEKGDAFKKGLEIFEKYLRKTRYAAGDHMTIADHSIVGVLSFAEVLIDYSFEEYANISSWLKRMKEEIPKYKEINETPLREFREYFESKTGN